LIAAQRSAQLSLLPPELLLLWPTDAAARSLFGVSLVLPRIVYRVYLAPVCGLPVTAWLVCVCVCVAALTRSHPAFTVYTVSST